MITGVITIVIFNAGSVNKLMVLVFLQWNSALSIALIRAYRGELWIGKQCKKLTKNDANINSVKLFAI